jgi:hypothetical protein
VRPPNPGPSLEEIETNPIPDSSSAFVRVLRKQSRGEWEAVCDLYRRTADGPGTTKWESLVNCHSHMYFAVEKETGKVSVWGSGCKQRWCPVCSAIRARGVAYRAVNWLRTLREPKFLTLTLQHSARPLNLQIDTLYHAFSRLRSRVWWKRSVRQGVWFSQVTYNPETATWHPHLHCVIDMSFIRQSKISESWLSVTGDSKVVDIRRVRDDRSLSRYVSRYVSRPQLLSALPRERQPELYYAYHGRRLCGFFGQANQTNPLRAEKVDRTRYLILGTYNEVIAMSQLESSYREVVESWLFDRSLSQDTLNFIYCPVPRQPGADLNKHPPWHQLMLFFHNPYARCFSGAQS